MTTIEVNGTEISYSDWSVTAGNSDVLLAPEATVETAARAASVTAGDRLEILRDDSTTVFDGSIEDAPTQRDGSQKLTCEHDYYRVFEENVDVSLTTPTASAVLEAALDASAGGSSADLTYNGPDPTLGDDYNVTGRSVKRIFRDIAERAGVVWWVGTGDSVTVNSPGARGTWASLDSSTDRFVVTQYDEADLETVVNVQQVVGTGGERVSATAEDGTSISNYSRREGDPVNVSYIRTATEASEYAEALLQPEPGASAEVIVPDGVGGDTSQILANYEVDVTDTNGTGMDEALVVERQIIEEGRATFELGAAAARGTVAVNRSAKSQDDKTEAGSVYGNERLANDSVDTDQLVDAAVIEDKLEDLAVATDKLQNNAVINGKLDDLSVSETKIQDGSIATPKMQAFAITANTIDTDAITASKIRAGNVTAEKLDADLARAQRLLAGEIEALDIATDTLTANEIDTLDLDTGELSVSEASTSSTLSFETRNLAIGDSVVAVPTGNVSLGDSFDRFDFGYFEELNFSDQIFATGTNPLIYPETDNVGSIGLGTQAWSEVNAHNVTEVTPEPLDSVSLGDLAGLSWRNPPEYAAQKKAPATDEREYRRANPKREGVELGHMTNWLLEVTKAQQETIDELEQRLSRLEDEVNV